MDVFPVLDLLNGVVVRGVGGQRETYRPVESRICASAEPLDVARAFRDQFGLERLYVADLDAILQRRPNLDVYRQLTQEGFTLLVDAGIQDANDAARILKAGAQAVIAGLESIPQPDLLLPVFQRLFEAVDGQVHYTAPRRVAMRRRASR